MATIKDHVLTIRVPQSIHDAINALAKKEDEPQAVLIRRLLRKALELEAKGK